MKTKLLSFLIVCFICCSSYAQEQTELFKVLASKGTNTVATGSSTEWKAVTPGKKLYKDDKLKISENGYIGLVHKSGKTLELKKAGTYTVSQLGNELASQNAGMGKKYVDYVVSEMTAKDDDMAKNRHKYMNVTGSVERGTGDNISIQVLSPKEVYVLNTPVMLKWQAIDNAKVYVIKINNMFDEQVFSMETPSNSAIVDLGKLNFKKEKIYLWSVSLKENPKMKSEFYALRYVTDEKAEKLNTEIAALKAELSENTALNKIVMASYYEENKLLIDAIENYEEAIKMEPTVEDYQAAYGQFLDRNGIVKTKK